MIPAKSGFGVGTAAPGLEGDLDVFPPADLFQFAGLLGLTGTLEFSRETASGPERVALVLRSGRLVGAETSGPCLHLGELLVRRFGVGLDRVVDGLRRQTAVRRSEGRASRLGEILLSQRIVEPEVLRGALEEQVSRVAGPVLLWDSGRFAFWSTMQRERLEVSPEVSLEELVLRRWTPPESLA